jgi:hypothetical protein
MLVPVTSILLGTLRHCFRTAFRVVLDVGRLFVFSARSRSALAAENLFLRKQLALFQERKVKPHRADDATRWMMASLSRMFQWRDALVNVKPDTPIRWHRKGFRLFWRWKSRPVGRPRLPKDLQGLIRKMAAENPTWGEERIANQLKLKLGVLVYRCHYKPPAARLTSPPSTGRPSGSELACSRWLAPRVLAGTGGGMKLGWNYCGLQRRIAALPLPTG